MLLHIKVKPNSSKQSIEKWTHQRVLTNSCNPTTGSRRKIESYLVYLKSAPENDKANTELINFLSKEFGTPHKNINIKFGRTSNKKIVEIK